MVGSYPIAHLREPYTAVGYLGKYLDLPTLLRMEHPSGDKPEPGEKLEWSAYDICEGWAIKRGFMTKRAARPDVARAANHLLRLALEGRICLFMRPPNYAAELERWESDPELEVVTKIRALGQEESQSKAIVWEENDESEEEEQDEKRMKKEDEESSDSDQSESEEEQASHQNKFALLGDDD